MKKKTFDVTPPISHSTDDNVSSLSESVQAFGLDDEKTLFNVLDTDVLGYICVFLTGLELCLLRRVCKASLTIVDQYQRRVFSVDRILTRFFTLEEIKEFRLIQVETDFVISGSAAVQFFERISYPDSDLDLYIEEGQMERLSLFMEKSGYAFKNTPSQPDNILTALQQQDIWATISGEDLDQYGWEGESAIAVFSFEKQLPSGQVRKVQAIVSTCEVIATVLAFHSTVVMNIITHQSAISFFPVSSFHRYHTIVTASNAKNARRGWLGEQLIAGAGLSLFSLFKVVPFLVLSMLVVRASMHTAISTTKKKTIDITHPIPDSTSNNLPFLPKPVHAPGFDRDMTLFNALVCKTGRAIVDQYMRSIFSVDRSLSSFFTPQEITDFRHIQAETRLVLSGSAAVQFFEHNRNRYPDSDLDLFIEERHAEKVDLFMKVSGYTIEKAQSEPHDILTTLRRKASQVANSDRDEGQLYDWDIEFPITVFSFQKQLTSGKIRNVQAIVCTREVISIILALHSSLCFPHKLHIFLTIPDVAVVANMITHEYAVSIFPVSSFHRYHTVVKKSNVKLRAWLKYFRPLREWSVIELDPPSSNYSPQKCAWEVVTAALGVSTLVGTLPKVLKFGMAATADNLDSSKPITTTTAMSAHAGTTAVPTISIDNHTKSYDIVGKGDT
ncbi:hypothetical protein DL96DRAFT_1774284 [Flagelloscypha sp. PMI_526]|nr:hypothetical protein DL96DRAFT_1774284 [Flagelloscypha sp. PMI_526]